MAYRENMGKSAEHNTTEKLKIVTSMFIFGTIGLVRRNIPYSSTMIAFFRGAIAVLILLTIRLIRHHSIDGSLFGFIKAEIMAAIKAMVSNEPDCQKD